VLIPCDDEDPSVTLVGEGGEVDGQEGDGVLCGVCTGDAAMFGIDETIDPLVENCEAAKAED